jgi:hypothetical protein
MKEERKQILEMLSQGTITAEDAARLLDKLDSGEGGETASADSADSDRPAKPKYLRVHVDTTDGDKVNVQIPLALIRTGIKLAALLPKDVNEKLGEKGVDLSMLSGLDAVELYETLSELKVDVDASDGDTVRVFCE